MSSEILIPLIKKVAKHRQDVLLTREEKLSTETLMLETVEGEAFQSRSNQLQKEQIALATAEDELRLAALSVYDQTGETKPIDKVEVKIFTELEYDRKEVEAWARTFAPTMLTLNVKAFGKVAENLTDAPVKINKVPKCTIAQDLSCYLSEKAFDIYIPLYKRK